MIDSNSLPTIAIINTSDDYLDIMRRLLNSDGFVAAPLTITKIKSGEINFNTFINEFNPQIILFDIAFPYRENWLQYQNIQKLDICKGRKFILTTPNIDALRDRIGDEVGAMEVVDKDIDLKKIVAKVRETWGNMDRKVSYS